MLAMRDVERIVNSIGELAAALAPRFDELGRAIGPHIEKVFWPEGAPEVITWSLLWERTHAWSRERAERETALTSSLNAGMPGGIVPQSTGDRIAAHPEARTSPREHFSRSSFADNATFGDAPLPPSLRFTALVSATSAAMCQYAGWALRNDDDKDPETVGTLLCELIADVAFRFGGILRAIDKREWAEQIESIIDDVGALREELCAAAERAKEKKSSPVQSTQPNGAATAALLEQLGARVAQLAPTLATIVEEEIFEGSPPRRVSFHGIQVAIDAKIYGNPLPPEVAQMHAMVADADRLLMPDDDDPISALELLEGTAESIRTAAAKLLALPEHERDEIAPTIEIQSRLYLLGVVSIAHSTRRQLLVADIASAVGLNPIPFPDDLPRGGSA